MPDLPDDPNPGLPSNVIPMPGLDPQSIFRDLRALSANADHHPGFHLEALDQPRLLPRPASPLRFTVRIDLDGAQPPIWRRLVLDGGLSLAQLHGVLQVAMGWTDCHLHQFRMGPMESVHRTAPFVTDLAEAEGDEGTHERDVRLDEVVAEPGHVLVYEYDLGDGWDHTLRVESVAPRDGDAPAARCLEGERACPPEDAGGVHGYEEMLALRAPGAATTQWDRHRLSWLGDDFDPEAFDVEVVDAVVQRVGSGPAPSQLPRAGDLAVGLGLLLPRLDNEGAANVATWLGAGALDDVDLDEQTAAALTAPWRTLLALVGEEGLALTGAGYLRPATVVELLTTLPLRHPVWGKGNREEHAPPVAALRASATALGLVRKLRGRLLVTAAGRPLADDPVALAHHLAARLPCGRGQHETEAGWLTLVGTAAGDERPERLASRILSGLGWEVDGGVAPHDARHWARATRDVLSLAGWNPDRWSGLQHDPRARVLAQLAVRA